VSTNITAVNKAKAWTAHGVTATGVVLALMAILALFDNQPRDCLLWLGAALLVDGLDGTLARRVQTSTMLPNFDGSTLDLVIDYLTYVFIPAIFIYRYIDLPDHTALVAVSLILVSSLFCFCNLNMKSSDNYFVGFPAAWNVVALYVWIIDPPAVVSLLLICVLAALTLTKLKFLHPFRVRKLMPLNIVVTFVWMIGSMLLILQHPFYKSLVLGIWWLASAYFVGICLWRSLLDWTHKLKA
jgi:phosphatidylcholine synthase